MSPKGLSTAAFSFKQIPNIAPTIIDLLGKEKPAEMTEESLIIHK